MALIDLMLHRRARQRSSTAPTDTRTCRPRVEVLENRECPSVAAPTGLQLTAISSTQVKVAWNDGAGEAGYRIFRWDGTQAILVTTVAANVKTFTVAQLPPNQMQWFTVEAFDLSTTARSAWASVTTPPQAITVPGNVHVVSTSLTQVNLAWSNATGATGYRIFLWDGTQAQLIGATTPTVPAFSAKNLTPGTTYYFYVEAFNATNSAASDWVTAITTAQGITAPANFKTQSVNSTTIGLSWNDGANETGYRVYRWNGVTGTNPVLIATLAANTTGFQATGLLPGKTYWFYVQAFNATDFANTAWVTGVTPGIPLQAPSQVAAVPIAPNTVKVTWTEPARAVGYHVFVWNGFSWTLATTVAAGTHSVQITGLASYRTHWFMVEAFTANHAEVAYSSAVFVNL